MIRLLYPPDVSRFVVGFPFCCDPKSTQLNARQPPSPYLFLALFPLFHIPLAPMIPSFSANSEIGTERWIWARSRWYLIPTSIWTICKETGGFRKFAAFAYLAMTALFVVKLQITAFRLDCLSAKVEGLAASPPQSPFRYDHPSVQS